MMEDSSQNPVTGISGYTSSQHSYVQGRSAENPVAGQKYNPASRRNIHKQRRTLPKEATKILSQWLNDHCRRPFPTEEEKKRLAGLTKLTEVQVSNWFINARRRQLPNILAQQGVSVEDVLKRKTSKVNKEFHKKESFPSEQMADLNIAKENSRADPRSGYDERNVAPPMCCEQNEDFCINCNAKMTKSKLDLLESSDPTYNMMLLFVTSYDVLNDGYGSESARSAG